jgi:hypothetical protein
MHDEILSREQLDLLPLIKRFKREYYLVGGTAIALHLGHRRSVDYDLFKSGPVRHRSNLEKMDESVFGFQITYKAAEQMNLIVNGVKVTFMQFPYPVVAHHKFGEIIRLPGLTELAAMKAFALGRRSKWKDYVDLYFIVRDHLSIEQISGRASEIFGQLYSDKLFRAQLSFFEDIDFSEAIEFVVPPVDRKVIMDFLSDKATDIF